ncbi:VCBS repeat-containing protein [Mucilaginibacter terrenus]|uniref:VCBS repeat-containing protein n=1 Tax=Mucilaginibacter terrenus TaxID=2482727 RepID=A0A3E2NJJ3_9SPHI|nr:VCBS repeat-containing protein [Mucilaginibacter terrenus]RFZ81093.1 VCBS repeat-containing protein [Mucilaginibacter terrenus]
MRKAFLYSSFILLGGAALAASTLIYGCGGKTSNTTQLTGDTIADGKHLVQRHCTRCHSLVPVNALTKDVWTVHTLPAMAGYFSIKTYSAEYYKEEGDTTGLSLLEWQAIASYYKKLAPDTLLPAKAPAVLSKDWAGFTLRKAARSNDISFTTMITANPATGKIYSGDVVSGMLTEWDNKLKISKSINLPSAAVNLNFLPDSAGIKQAIATCIGRLDPIDFPNGRVFKVNLGPKLTTSQMQSELPRPVQTLSADLDKDGNAETIICSPGNLKGGVYVLKQDPKTKSYKQTAITERPGAVQAVTGDFNNDGFTDVMVLYSVNDEGLAMYLNNKKGGFDTHELLKFPPVNGSTSFQLADLDHDGDLDLVYTCGYNFRDSRILKPYHGVYIFKNTGNFNLKQEWFYPVNGCSKAIAADFDGDGDLDIATIAFFADMKNNPAEEFIYFEQDKDLHFKPHAIPVSKNGRWMTMDVNDVNGDGKPDILLGNYASGFLFQPNFSPNWDENTPFIVLENHIKK